MKTEHFFNKRILWSIILCLLMPASFISQTYDMENLEAGMEREIKKAMLEGNIPSMTIALVSGDKVIWKGAYGFTNLWAKTPAAPNSVYLIGSTFKTMSMYALLQQMEKGKFKLDDAVNDYLTEFKIKDDDPKNPVTFRHLLTHTSGLPAAFGPHSVWGDTVPAPLKDYLAGSLKLGVAPNTKVIYSNLAYTLIAYFVEKFSGVPYKRYIRANIFKPIEMRDTEFFPRPDMEERLAIPYVYNSRTNYHLPTNRSKADVWPAGIVYGTILDQAKWLITNLNRGVYKDHRFIKEETFKQVMTRQHEKFTGPISAGWLNESTGFGLTWWISQHQGDTLFAHSGSVNGFTAFIVGNLNKKIGFAVLTNGNRSHAHLFDLSSKALELMEKFRLNNN